ncbi:MAG: hypothetical protein LW698_13185 [Planctomycetaceae bacterium]|nr:hypothetical protein [Planctomycetaceae bacterium]
MSRPVVRSDSGTSTASVAAATASTGHRASRMVRHGLATGVSTSTVSGRTPAARARPTRCGRPASMVTPPTSAASAATAAADSAPRGKVAAPAVRDVASQTTKWLPVSAWSVSSTCGESVTRDARSAAASCS